MSYAVSPKGCNIKEKSCIEERFDLQRLVPLCISSRVVPAHGQTLHIMPYGKCWLLVFTSRRYMRFTDGEISESILIRLITETVYTLFQLVFVLAASLNSN